MLNRDTESEQGMRIGEGQNLKTNMQTHNNGENLAESNCLMRHHYTRVGFLILASYFLN